MVRRVMKDAFVVWKNSRSIFGLTNYFAGQPRVAGAILSILFGLFLSACGGGGGVGSPPNVGGDGNGGGRSGLTLNVGGDGDGDGNGGNGNGGGGSGSQMSELEYPIFVDAPVQGLHYRPVGPTVDISISEKTDVGGEFMSTVFGSVVISRTGTVAFAVGEITVDGDGMTLSQYGSNGFLGFIVHPAGQWQSGVFTPYDLRNANGNAVIAGTVNVGAVARVLQGFDEFRASTSPVGADILVGADIDEFPILIHPGATAERTVTFGSISGQITVQESGGPEKVDPDEGNYLIKISENLPEYDGATLSFPLLPEYDGVTLNFPLLANAMKALSMVISVMADEISPFSDNSAITLKNGEARTGYFARRGSYSLDSGESDATINPNTGELTYTPTHGEPPQSVVVTFRYGGDQIIRNQTVELDSLPRLKTDSKNFQIYFTGGKYVALTLDETTGGNLPLSYELTIETLSELKRYNLIFDHESGILFGTPQQEAFTVSVALDIVDSGGDDAKPLGPDLEFQIVSREGAPAYYEIDLSGGAGSFATLHFPDRDGNEVSEESTEESIAGIDSACQDGSAAGFGKTDCPYSADYIFGGAKHPEGLGDIPGVMVVVGLKPTSGGVTVCASVDSICPAGVKAFTISFQNENDGKPLSVNARVLLPRPAFDPASASENFATYIAFSPNPSRRPLPAADGGNGRLIYSVSESLPDGLTLHSATRRLLGRPTVIVSNNMPDMSVALTMTVRDSNGDGESASYLFTVVVQPDHIPVFEDANGNILTAITLTATLSMATTFTLSVATNTNRETIYFVSRDDIPPGMTFDSTTRQLSGAPTKVGSFPFDYIATDLDEHRDENGDLITPVALREIDDDKVTLEIVVFVDGKPSFGSQTVSVPAEGYIQLTPIAALTLPEATGGNGTLMYDLSSDSTTSLAGLDFDRDGLELSGTPTESGNFTFTLTATDSDDEDPDSAILTFSVSISGNSAPMFPVDSFGPITLTQAWPITSTITLTAATGGNLGIDYSIEDENALPGGVMFDGGDTRELSGTPTAAGMFTIRIIAKDGDGNEMDSDRGTLEVIITVEANIAPVLPADSAVNQSYIQNSEIPDLTLSAVTSDGNGETRYSIEGRLPPGLSFNRNNMRILRGRPTVAGDFPLIYKATDSDPDPVDLYFAAVSFTLSVARDLIPSFTESVPQQNYFQGATIAMTVLPAASEGNVSLIYEDALGLPNGIVFDTVSRQLSGTPTGFGEFVATIVAVDTDGTTDDSDDDRATLTFSIQVEEDIEPSFGSQVIPDQTYMVSVQINNLPLPAAARGNKGPLMYSLGRLSSPILPPGLFFNPETRIITGTPTEIGVFDNINYVVQDSNGRSSAPLVFTITVVASP